MKKNQSSFIYISLGIALLCYWFFAKLEHFNSLNYTSDMFHMHQISRTWYEKGVLFLENAYGGQSPVHSYFLIFAFSPLTALLGIKGFFAGYTLLLFLLFLLIGKNLTTKFKFLFAFAYLLGPIAFWLYDDPTYGFQLELMYAPLSLLFFIALESKNKKFILASVVAIILVREEGPIVAATVFLSHRLFNHFLLGKQIRIKDTLIKLGGFFVLFCLTLSWLKLMSHLNPDHPAKTSSRIFDGIENFLSSVNIPYYRGQYWRMLKYLCALPLLSFMLLFKPQTGIKLFALWIFVGLPFLVINYISAATYFPMVYEFGLTWPYRAAPQIGLFWGLLFLAFKHLHLRTSNKYALSIAALLLITAQIHILKLDRQYDAIKHFTPHANKSDWKAAKLSSSELEQAKCFSKSLPKRYPIASSGHLFALGAELDLVWSDREKYSPVTPKLYLCHENLGSPKKPCFQHKAIPEEKLGQRHYNKLHLFYNTEYMQQILPSWHECLNQNEITR